MAKETDEDTLFERIAQSLDEAAKKPNPNRKRTLRDRVAEPAMLARINAMRTAGYGMGEIAALFTSQGVKTSAGTLAAYVRAAEKEQGSERDGKRQTRRSGKPTTGTKDAAPSDTGQGSGTQAKANEGGTGKQPSDGKRLSTPPGMGGAFGADNL